MSGWKEERKDLVAEQPGLGLSLIGLFLALFIGLAVRAAISPERVRSQLEQATAQIHKDLQIQFKKAGISFSQGIWPDLSVVIEDIVIESKRMCWFHPVAEINEIRLPLSFRHLLGGKILIHEILADEVNLSLREPFENCSGQTPETQINEKNFKETEKSAGKSSSLVGLESRDQVGRFENVSRDNPIDSVIISKLKIHYLPMAFTSFYLDRFEARLKSDNPRWLQISGRLNLEGDFSSRDHSSFAQLQMDLVEGAEPSLNAQINGGWGEGNYNVLAHVDPKGQKYKLDADFRQLPLNRIIPILKKYRWVESEFNGKRAWITGKIRTQGTLPEAPRSPIYFTDWKLEGDLGEISCQQAEVESFQPFKIQPVDLQIKGLNIKELLAFLHRPHPSAALGNLGVFNGSARVTDLDRLRLRGDYSGLEFIFSNRGTRQVQALSLVSGELELQRSRWKIQVDRAKPVEGLFEGKIEMEADKDFRNIAVDASISELGLSPKIQTLMTGGGSFGALSGQVKLNLLSAQIASISGQLKWDQLFIEGVKLLRPKVQIRTVQQDVELQVVAQELEILPQSVAFDFFAPIFGQPAGEETLSLKSPAARIQTRKFNSFEWKQFQAQSQLGLLRSHGQWDESSRLSGQVSLAGKKPKVWILQGTRSEPRFFQQTLSEKSGD